MEFWNWLKSVFAPVSLVQERAEDTPSAPRQGENGAGSDERDVFNDSYFGRPGRSAYVSNSEGLHHHKGDVGH